MEPIGHLLEEVKITKLNDASAAGVTTINSAVVDMQGFDGIVFLTNAGTIAATGTAAVKVQQDTAIGMGGAADLAGSGQSFVDTDDNKSVAVDVKRPLERYVTPRHYPCDGQQRFGADLGLAVPGATSPGDPRAR